MTNAAQHALDAALKLSAQERGTLARNLLASLDGEPDQDVEAAWAEEVEQRARKLLSGEDPGHAWEDVRARLQAEFGG